MLPSDLENLRVQLEAETGMNLAGDRASRLRDAISRVNVRSDDVAMLERLTAELTVGETYFFRNEHHFQALRDHVVNDIVATNADKKQVRVWSAGCATGEEPYSVAILLDQMLAGKGLWQVTILGTDINQAFLERARQGMYRQWSFRQTNIHNDRRYFAPEGDMFRLAPAIRERVHFGYLNLVKDVYPSPLSGTLGLDLILFRNVAIYLKADVIRAIIARFYLALRPGGWLLLGETEMNLVPQEGFEVRHLGPATFYRKRGGQAEAAAVPMNVPLPILMPATPASTLLGQPAMLPVWSKLPVNRSSPAAPVRSIWERIQHSVAQGQFADAERTLEQIPAAKERAGLRLRYVHALLACAEQARATRMLEVCLREDPLLLEAHLLKASFAEEADDLHAAELAYRQALYIDRKCPMAHFHLALVQQQRGQPHDANRSLKTIMKLIDHKDPHALVDYGEGICYGRLKEMIAALSS